MAASPPRLDAGLVATALPGRTFGAAARGTLVSRAPLTDGLAAEVPALGPVDLERRLVDVPALPGLTPGLLVFRAAALAERDVFPADAGMRAAAVRPVLPRVAGVRLAAARAEVVGTVAIRFVVAAGLARVVVFTFVLLAEVLAADLDADFVAVPVVRVADARADFGSAADSLARVALIGFAAVFLEAGFFATTGREVAVPVRVVRLVPPRALVPAARRPPARTAMAHRLGPLISLPISSPSFQRR